MTLRTLFLSVLLIGPGSVAIGSATESTTDEIAKKERLLNRAKYAMLILKDALAKDELTSSLARELFWESCKNRNYKITWQPALEKLKGLLDSEGKVAIFWAEALQATGYFKTSKL